jgi:hypothetical protein
MRCNLDPSDHAVALSRTILLGALSEFEDATKRQSPPSWSLVISSVETATSAAVAAGARTVAEVLRSASETVVTALKTNSALVGAELCGWVTTAVTDACQGAGGGHTDLFDDLFLWALALAERHYKAYAGCWLGAGASLVLGPRDGPPFASRTELRLSASTAPPDPATGKAAVIDLRLTPEGINLQTAASAPYLLVHECICHAGQGSTKVANKSTFSEGWMDHVAETIFNAEVVNLGWNIATALVRRTGLDLILALEDPDCGTANWQHRLTGRQVANKLADLYLRRDGSAGRDSFLALSFALNAAPLNPDARDLFVWDVERALLRPGNEVRLMYALADWHACRFPADRLLQVVHEIP